MAADNTRKTSNVIHDLATLKTQVENNTNNISNATQPNDGKINLSVGTGLVLGPDSNGTASANASANQAGNTSWNINLDTANITLSQYIKTVDGVSPNSTTGDVDLKSSDNSLNIAGNATSNSIDLTLNGTIPTVNDKTIGLKQGTGIDISGSNSTTNMSSDNNQTISLNASISDLTDVNTTGALENQALVYNGTQWLPGTVSGGDGTVKKVGGVGPNTTTGDVSLSSPNDTLSITKDTANHTVKLEANLTTLNSSLGFAKKTDIGNGSISIIEGTGINVTGSNATANQSTNSNWTINLNANLSQLNDVSDTTASNNQVLTYDNGSWKPAASQTGGVTELAALNDTNVSAPETGEILVYDKPTGKWNNQAPGENTAELPISSSDDSVTLSSDMSTNFIVETGKDVFERSTNASIFGTSTNPYGDATVISLVDPSNQVYGGVNVGDTVTGNRIPDGTVVVSKDEAGYAVTLSQSTTGDSLSTEEVTFSTPSSAMQSFQERLRIDGIGQITAETADYDENVVDKSLVTKAWVEANGASGNLPISSSDNKVTLSDDGGTFYIETGSTEAGKSKRVAVASGGQLLVGDTTLENANFNMHVADDDNVQICIDATDVSATTGAVLKLRTGDDKYWNIQHTQNVSGSSEDNQLIINNGSGTAFLRGYQDNSANFGHNVIVQGQVQTDTITDKDGVGASIGLGSSVNSVFIDSTSGFTGSGIRFEVNQKSAGSTVTNFDGFATIANTLADSKIATMSGSRTSMRNTGAGAEVNQVFGYYVYEMPAAATLTGDNPIAAGLRLTNNNSGDGDYNILADGTAPSKFWGPIEYSSTDLITKDEHLVTKGWVTANGASGNLPISSTDDKVTLSDDDGTFQIETGDPTASPSEKLLRVSVKPASDGSAAVTVGEEHAQSIGGISVKNDPTKVTYTSQMQVRFVDENGKYAYTGLTEPRFNGGSTNALISGGVFYAGHDNGDALIFSKTNDVIVATGGLTASNERLRVTDDAAIFDGQIQTNTITTKTAATNDAVFGLINNQVDIIRASLDVQPMLGVSTLNGYGLGSDGIVVESADVFTAPEGWDEETQGDAAQQPDQPRSGIAFKGPYLLDNEAQNYYASIEGVRGGRTNGYKSGACRISVNSTGSSVPSMNQAAYFGWDQSIVKAGNDNVAVKTIWNSGSIVHAAPIVVNVPVASNGIGWWQSNFYDGSRANALGWYPVDYGGGTVNGIGAGGTFLWADNGNGLALAADGIRINSQASGALTSHQWEFTTEGHLVSQGGRIQTDTITSKDAATGDAEVLLGSSLTVKANNKNQVQVSDTNCLRTLQVGSASKPALAFSDTTTGFFFAPDDANQYNTNGSGVAFTIANANSGISPREIFRVNRTGQILVTDEYNVGSDNVLATKKYVDSRIWKGTQSEYNALSSYDDDILYCITG
jgi:hypothetical protein